MVRGPAAGPCPTALTFAKEEVRQMKKTLLILTAAILTTSIAQAEHAQLKVYREAYSNEIAAAIRPLTERYGKQLYNLQAELIKSGNIDDALTVRAERERIKAAEPASVDDLKKQIQGTSWQWCGQDNDAITFGPNGRIIKSDWQQRGLETKWDVIDDNTVLLTITKGRPNDLHATLVFNDKRSEFSGDNFHRGDRIPASKKIK